jgi:hypothetical protein
MKDFIYIAGFSFLLVFAGCAASTPVAKSALEVAVVEEVPPGVCQELDTVEASGQTGELALEELRAQASLVGANVLSVYLPGRVLGSDHHLEGRAYYCI